MTVKRKDENESDFEREARIAKTTAANFSPRSEKTSWIRKRNNLDKYISENINPIEEVIQDKHLKMMESYTEMAQLDESEREQFATTNITPLETEIQELQQGLIEKYDEVDRQRKEMVSTCVHPYDELRYNVEDKTVRCTFCNKKMLPRG